MYQCQLIHCRVRSPRSTLRLLRRATQRRTSPNFPTVFHWRTNRWPPRSTQCSFGACAGKFYITINSFPAPDNNSECANVLLKGSWERRICPQWHFSRVVATSHARRRQEPSSKPLQGVLGGCTMEQLEEVVSATGLISDDRYCCKLLMWVVGSLLHWYQCRNF